jgi:alpha-tubulin suppressor-like RCC1 family protein
VDNVCSGWSHTIWLVEGKVYSWGRNNFGQLGRLVGPNQTGEDCRVKIDEEILIIESGT